MPLLIATRKGGVKCSSACPWYTESGKVRGIDQMPLKTHCRMTMHPWMVDCDQFDPCRIETVEVSEEQWQEMLAAVGRKAKRQRKLYPEEHEEIHNVGESYPGDETKGRRNARKSASAGR